MATQQKNSKVIVEVLTTISAYLISFFFNLPFSYLEPSHLLQKSSTGMFGTVRQFMNNQASKAKSKLRGN